MRALGIRLDARLGENARQTNHEQISDHMLRSLAILVAQLQKGRGSHCSHGLINEHGKPAWEEPPEEEDHEFRRYVYEILRCREQS